MRPSCRNPDSTRKPKTRPILKNLFIQTHVSAQLQAQLIPLKVAIEKSLLLEENCVKKHYQTRSCIDFLELILELLHSDNLDSAQLFAIAAYFGP